MYALILTRFRLGFLHVIFSKFVTELWLLTDVRTSFPLNIFRKNGQVKNQIKQACSVKVCDGIKICIVELKRGDCTLHCR